MADYNSDQGLGYVVPRTGPDAGTKRYKQPAERTTHFGNAAEDAALDEESSSTTTPSNSGRAAQSTDASNQY